jgi:predicted RNase H-like HicB family nuclease
MKYLVIVEPTSNGFSAYSPDLDGCVAAAEAREETIALMQEAMKFHLEGLAAAGIAAPPAQSEATLVDVAV